MARWASSAIVGAGVFFHSAGAIEALFMLTATDLVESAVSPTE